MASIEHIEARILDMDLHGLPGDFAILTCKLREFIEWQEQVLAAARAELELATAWNNTLAEELERSKKYTKHLLNHRRIIDMGRSEAVAHLAHIQAQVERLWAALQPVHSIEFLQQQWHTIEQELTCHICCSKLWSAVRFISDALQNQTHLADIPVLISLVPCGHISHHGKGALTCVSCNLIVTRCPLWAHLVEKAIRKLPTVNEEECTDHEEADQKCGY
ncbi:hypothetical protein F5146DRAFT_1006767 [Armillaria mellea]|nr:hypothetical protein F5146DRAFT_1006767 [Armillaria mellea]